MSVFGSNNERLTPGAMPERRPAAATADLSFESLMAPNPASQPARAPTPAPAPAARKASVLGKTLIFRGELSADEDLVLQGRVEGSIHHSQSLTVGVDGVVVGDIHAANITIEGRVEGNLYGTASVLVGASANVQGNIASPRVGIREGAQFNGKVEMSPSAARATAPSTATEGLSDRVVDRVLQGQ